MRGLLEHGCRISKPYLSQLRRGHRSNPSDEVVVALADYFGVSPGYFFTAPLTAAVGSDVHAEDADIVERLDDPVRKTLLLAVSGLSVLSLELLADLATELRVSEHRAPVPADSPYYVRLIETALGSRRAVLQSQIRRV